MRNVSLENYTAHSEPLFKNLNILKFSDKLAHSRAVFMHKHCHNKLPTSFTGIFTHTITTDMMQSRHNDYNHPNVPAVKKT